MDSVLSQTYKKIEIIIVDDNGLDTTKQKETAILMNKYLSLENVHYVCHEINKNGSAARNTGVKISNGEYIALLDDDDVFLPDKIKRQVEQLSALGIEFGAVYCSHETFLNDNKVGEEHALMDGQFLYEYMMHKIEIASSSILVRRSVWEELGGFDESFKRHQDWEFITRLLNRYSIKSDDFLGFKRILQFRNSRVSSQVVKERRMFYLKKMSPIIKSLPLEMQQNIIVCERVDVAVHFLKAKNFVGFLKEMSQIRPRILTIKFFVFKLYGFYKRGCKLIN